MKKEEVTKLFDLLEQLYQGKKKSRDEVTVAIWNEVLKPWSYEQIRDAVIRRAREKRFMPDPSEIAEYLPRPEKSAMANRSQPMGAIERKHMEQARQWQAEWHKELHKLGLPTMREALEQGMSLAQWNKALKEGGAWD